LRRTLLLYIFFKLSTAGTAVQKFTGVHVFTGSRSSRGSHVYEIVPEK